MTHTAEQAHVDATRTSDHAQPPPRRGSLHTMIGWVVIAAALLAAVLLVLLTTMSETAPQRVEPEQTPPGPSLAGVPRSADAAERWLADHVATRPMGVPGSADAAERWLADHE